MSDSRVSKRTDIEPAQKHNAPVERGQARKSRLHPSDMYGITHSSDGRSWCVSLIREGVQLYKTFAFSIYGGKEAALVRAQGWRDEMARKHPPASRQKVADKVRRNNKSGIPGVVCMFDPQGRPTGWIAQTYLGPGKHLSKYFGVTRHGAIEAKLLAIAERQRQLQQMTGLRRIHPGEALVRTAPKRAPDLLPAPKARGTIFLSTNSSGIVGVSSERDKNGRPTRWIATTRLGSKQLSKSFSVLIHGDEHAKALAGAAREEQLQKRAELQREKSQSEKATNAMKALACR